MKPLGLVPEVVHLGERQLVDMTALLVGLLLDVVEPGDKFAVGTLQGVVGANTIETGCIDEREEQVTELLLTVHCAVILQLGLHFTELFTDLVPNVFLLLPIKAHIGGFLLDTFGLNE